MPRTRYPKTILTERRAGAVRILIVVMAILSAWILERPMTVRAQRAAFRSGVDIVLLNVSATDRSKRFVPDLAENDFAVFENGQKQDLTFFQKEALPLALALLIDTSASMGPSLRIAQDAAIRLVRELQPVDVASVIGFDTSVRLLQPFTSDKALLESAIRQTRLGGTTALYNALYVALKGVHTVARAPGPDEARRRALVVLSDGRDTSSLLGFDDILDLCGRTDVAVYAVGLQIPSDESSGPDGARFVLSRLSQYTGGRAFFPERAEYLADVYLDIKRDLSSQYAIAYESNNVRRDGAFRQISVRVARTGVVVRTRLGYFAASH
jgi:Ca-activated chloride channel homolog